MNIAVWAFPWYHQTQRRFYCGESVRGNVSTNSNQSVSAELNFFDWPKSALVFSPYFRLAIAQAIALKSNTVRCCIMHSRLWVNLAEDTASSEAASIWLVTLRSLLSIAVNCVSIAGSVSTSVIILDVELFVRAHDFSTEACMSLATVRRLVLHVISQQFLTWYLTYVRICFWYAKCQ